MKTTASLFDFFSKSGPKHNLPVNQAPVCHRLEFFRKENLLFLLSFFERARETSAECKQIYYNLLHYFNSSDFDRGFCKVTYLTVHKVQLSDTATMSKMGRIYGTTASNFGPYEKKVCLQSFPRWIRGLLGGTFYWDVDIQNAHPTLLLSMIEKFKHNFMQHAYPVSGKLAFPNLSCYVDSRDVLVTKIGSRLEQVGVKFSNLAKQMKHLFTIIFYGGSLQTWLKAEEIEEIAPLEEIEAQTSEGNFSLQGLRTEIQSIGRFIWQRWAEITAKEEKKSWEIIQNFLTASQLVEGEAIQLEESKNNGENIVEPLQIESSIKKRNREKARSQDPIFRFLSLILQNEERKCLLEIDSVLDGEGRKMDVYIHDGGLVSKKYRLEREQKGHWTSANPLTFCRQETPLFHSLIWEEEFPLELREKCEQKVWIQCGYRISITTKTIERNLISAHEKLAQLSPLTPVNQDNRMQLQQKYQTKSYPELFYFINDKKGVSIITDAGSFVDAQGRNMTEETFKRSLPHQTCTVSTSKSPVDFFSVYQKDNARTRYSSLAFMIEDEFMDLEEDSRGIEDNFEGGGGDSEFIESLFRQTSKMMSTQHLHTGKGNTFDDGVPNIRYLFNKVAGWPILQKLKIPYTLSYNMEDRLCKWLQVFKEHGEKLKIADLFCFEPLFPVAQLEALLFNKNSSPKYRIHPALYPILNHLYVLVNKHLGAVCFVLQYFAQIAQFPNRRYGGTGLILFSEGQGTGKSLFIKLIFLIFDPFTTELHNLEADLFGRFSDSIEQKVLLHIEDVPGNQLWRFKEYLKSSITADTTRVEKKNKDPYRVSNFCRYVVSTNCLEKLGLDEKDRRWSVIPCSDEISKIATRIGIEQQENSLPSNQAEEDERFEIVITKQMESLIVCDEEEQDQFIEEIKSRSDMPDDKEEDRNLRKGGKRIIRKYFILLNLYVRRSLEVQCTLLKFLKDAIDVNDFHPEQDCPFKSHSLLKELMNLHAPTEKVTKFEKFFIGLSNFFSSTKEQKLFPKYTPRKEMNERSYLKEFVWVSSMELVGFYNNKWSPLENSECLTQEPTLSVSDFAKMLKDHGKQASPPRDYSPVTIKNQRHLPIDCKFWEQRRVDLQYDVRYIINISSLAKNYPKEGQNSNSLQHNQSSFSE